MTRLVWNPIRSAGRGRSIAYWRLEDGGGRSIASVSRLTVDGETAYRDQDTAYWRALLYGPDPRRSHDGRQDLGSEFPTRAAAEQAVFQALRLSGHSITCPRCGLTSYNPNDTREGYCGNCCAWTSGGIAARIAGELRDMGINDPHSEQAKALLGAGWDLVYGDTRSAVIGGCGTMPRSVDNSEKNEAR